VAFVAFLILTLLLNRGQEVELYASGGFANNAAVLVLRTSSRVGAVVPTETAYNESLSGNGDWLPDVVILVSRLHKM